MKDAELRSLLKSAPPPARSAEEREAFTGRVMARLHRNRAVEPEARGSWLAPLAWGAGLALASVAVGFVIGRTNPAIPHALRQSEQQLRASITSQAQQLGLMMQSENAAPGLAVDAR
jgi:hypothetical protein